MSRTDRTRLTVLALLVIVAGLVFAWGEWYAWECRRSAIAEITSERETCPAVYIYEARD